MVDTQGLGPCALKKRGGSSPLIRTLIKILILIKKDEGREAPFRGSSACGTPFRGSSCERIRDKSSHPHQILKHMEQRISFNKQVPLEIHARSLEGT